MAHSPDDRRLVWALALAIGQYAVVALLLFLFDHLDSGLGYQLFWRSFGFAVAAHVLGCGWVTFRCRRQPTAFDLGFIRWGFAPLWGVAYLISRQVLLHRGFAPRLL